MSISTGDKDGNNNKENPTSNILEDSNKKSTKNYFEPRLKDEEYPYIIDTDTQARYEMLEDVFYKICPEQTLDEAKVHTYIYNIQLKSRAERTRLGMKNDDHFIYGEVVSIIFIP